MNMNQNQRDALIFKNINPPYGNGIARFQGVTLETVEELVAKKFLHLRQKQNKSPTTREFIQFAQDLVSKYPNFAGQIFFHGFVVDKSREDYRTVIEGMSIERGNQDINSDILKSLKFNFRMADTLHFENGEFWCWFDD